MTLERPFFPPRAADCTSTRPHIARRGFLCAIAGAVPTAALVAAARPVAAAAVPDPIFAAIEAHRRAVKAMERAAGDDDDKFNDLRWAADDVAKQLLQIEPTSFGGLAALLAYYAVSMIEDDAYFPEDHQFTEEEGFHCYGVKVAQLAASSVAKITARADYANNRATGAI